MYKYKNQTSGELDRFTGAEEIYISDKLVYKAEYHGGFTE